MSFKTPVALFVFNRPDHTAKTMGALACNEGFLESDLYIFSDAPRNETDVSKVNAVRELIYNIQKKYKKENVFIVEQLVNKGLADSIIEGVTFVVNKYGRVIVLEDDLVTSLRFLTYMNKALDIYEDEARVMHIAAYIPPVGKVLPDTYFYNQASCWGWGTWSRAWQKFNPDASNLIKLLEKNGNLDYFNLDNSFNFMELLAQNARKEVNTWAVKWQASVFLNNGLCLHPGKSLIQNIGLDWSGVHTGPMPQYMHKKLAEEINVCAIDLKESVFARKQITSFYKNKVNKTGLLGRFRKLFTW